MYTLIHTFTHTHSHKHMHTHAYHWNNNSPKNKTYYVTFPLEISILFHKKYTLNLIVTHWTGFAA